MAMRGVESCDAPVLPTLLTSKRLAREGEVVKAPTDGRSLRCSQATAPEAAFAHPISVKNTFVDYGSQRSPSLEPFYRQRKASSCPSSPAARGEEEQGAHTTTAVLAADKHFMLTESEDELKELRVFCAKACPQAGAPHGGAAAAAVTEAPTRCPSLDSPAEWQFFADSSCSPSETRGPSMTISVSPAAPGASPFAEAASPFHASMYTPMCSYAMQMGNDAFCLGVGGPSPMASMVQAPTIPQQSQASLAVPLAQRPQPLCATAATTVGSRPQARTGHTILSLADAISEPSASPTAAPALPTELNGVVSVANAATPLGSPTARAVSPPMPPAPPSESPLMSSGGSALAAAMSTGAAPPSPPKGPALGSAELPSVGSAGHNSGDCKPCAFFHTAGCSNGVSCQFCHTCDANEKKRRRKEKIQRERMAGKAKQAEQQPVV